MLNAHNLKKVVLNVTLLVINVPVNVNKVVFWLPYKIPDHYDSIKYNKATKVIDGSANWTVSNILETTAGHKKYKKEKL
jgi:hypothetical protein